MIDDTIIYDRLELTKDIFKILDEEGYIVSAFANGQVDICWNESLVKKKVNSDRRVLLEEEKRLNKYNKQSKIIHDRFNFLANPNKINKEPTLEEKLDQQMEKILKEKEKEQKKYSKMVR
jgi:hypothetical protein